MKKLYILISLMFIAASGFAQWTVLNSGTTNHLFSCYFLNSDTGYAVGWGGIIIKTTDGGSTWITQTSGTTESLTGVQFLNNNIGYITGAAGTILKTTNGGVSWGPQTIGTTQPLQCVFFTDINHGCVGGGYGKLYNTVDGGANWVFHYPGTFDAIMTIDFTDDTTGYAVSDNGSYVLKTTDAGNTWTSHSLTGSSFPFKSIFFTTADTGYVTGGNGRIFKTTDDGLNWNQLPYCNGDFWSIFFTDASTGYVVGGISTASRIFKTTNAGATWTSQSVSTTPYLRSVFFTDANTGYVVGESGVILKTTNGGVSIEESQLPESAINIFPNPATENLTIETTEKATIEILNIAGQIIKTINTTDKQTIINVENLSSGVYIIKAKTDRGVAVKRFIKD